MRSREEHPAVDRRLALEDGHAVGRQSASGEGLQHFCDQRHGPVLGNERRARDGAPLARPERAAQHADLHQGKEDRSGGQYPEEPVEDRAQQRLHDCRSAIDFNIPLITNARLASAFITAFCKLDKQDIKIKSWNEY